LAISIVLVGRQNGLRKSEQKAAVVAMTDNYLAFLDRFKDDNIARRVYFDETSSYGRLDNFLEDAEEENTRVEMLEKWTNETPEGKLVFDVAGLDDKLEKATAAEAKAIRAAMPAYIKTLTADRDFGPDFFEVEDVARRTNAGTGSLGVKRFYVLLRGDGDTETDDLILDVKEQQGPTAFHYANSFQRKIYQEKYPNEGMRHALAYEALAFHADDFLGYMVIKGVYYSVRERSPNKETLKTQKLDSLKRLTKLSEQWGRGLATAHARAAVGLPFNFMEEVGKLTGSDEEGFTDLVLTVATGYADQVEHDYKTFMLTLGQAFA
ncbi:MAG: DUF2252 family protein, partial [Verrucomicrobiota bacterium]